MQGGRSVRIVESGAGRGVGVQVGRAVRGVESGAGRGVLCRRVRQ